MTPATPTAKIMAAVFVATLSWVLVTVPFHWPQPEKLAVVSHPANLQDRAEERLRSLERRSFIYGIEVRGHEVWVAVGWRFQSADSATRKYILTVVASSIDGCQLLHVIRADGAEIALVPVKT